MPPEPTFLRHVRAVRCQEALKDVDTANKKSAHFEFKAMTLEEQVAEIIKRLKQVPKRPSNLLTPGLATIVVLTIPAPLDHALAGRV
jgi:hypothetical protein